MKIITIAFIHLILCCTLLIHCEQQYAYSTCKKGYEKLLKYEILSKYTNFKFAYSRPGLITWKVDSNLDEFIKEKSIIFLRSSGKSIISQVNNIQDVVNIGNNLKMKYNNKIRLHVFGREEEESCIRSEHPNEIAERKLRINQLKLDIFALDQSISLTTDHTIFHKEIEANEDDIVLDVCIGEENDKLFIGEHTHSKQYRTSTYPNNLFPSIILPDEAPSRAYMKTEEAILSFNIPMEPHQNVLEIGSAPGGSVYNLLNRGVKVYGVDPCPSDRTHSPVIKKNLNFIEILSKLHTLQVDKLPSSIQWMLCDANISPEDAIPHLQRIATYYHKKNELKGLIYTCKLNDDIFNWKPDRLITYLYNTRELLLNTCNQEIFTDVTITTLPSNKQEVLIYAKTKYI